MFGADRYCGIAILVSGALVVFGGLMGVALPHAAADVIVQLVRNSPPDDYKVYGEVAARLANGNFYFNSIFIVLGLVISICSWLAFFRDKSEKVK